MFQALRGSGRRVRAILTITMAALGAAGFIGQSAFASQVSPPADQASTVPVPPGNVAYLVGHAAGTQTYTCIDGAWSTKSVPDAILTDKNGHFLIHHFAGPTWQAKDGSSVQAAAVGSHPGGTGNIAWLVLKVDPAKTVTGPDGGDRLVATTYIQRLNTHGGVAPAGTCTSGDTTSVPYTADYYFYRAT